MNLPILEKLRQGEKFDFDTLCDSFEDIETYLEEWWDGRDMSKISRPETIEGNDSILESTKDKTSVDLCRNCEFFNEQLTSAINNGKFASCAKGDRNQFRFRLTRLIAANSIELESPQIIFAGGGYGSGKTTKLAYEASIGTVANEYREYGGSGLF